MKVFVSARMPSHLLEGLKSRFEIVDHYDWSTQGFLQKDEMISRLQGCQVLITESDVISAEIIEASLDLLIIVDCRGTPVNIDIEAASRHGVLVVNTPGRNAEAVADLTIALMIMISRNILPGIDAMKTGRWLENGIKWCYINYQGTELSGKTVGLIGFGAIARLVARRLAGFDMKVLTYDPYICSEDALNLGVTAVSLDELIQQSDYVSLHAPLNKTTKGMISEREFALMKPTAFLINTARAALTDEDALFKALKEKKIAGAAIDTFHKEPVPGDYPLLHLENVVATPHLGGATFEVIDHQAEIAIKTLFSLLDKNPVNVINQEVLESTLNNLS